MSSLPPRPSLGPPGRSSLRAREQQRVVCAAFVGRCQLPQRQIDEKLRAIEVQGARTDLLPDGSRIVIMERALSPSEQAQAIAQRALQILQLLPSAPVAVCTGRLLLEGSLPYGDVVDRGTELLAQTPPGVVRLDEASAALLEARFEISGEDGQRTLEGERRGGEAPRTLLGQVTPFVGRERELMDLTILFKQCTDYNTARTALVVGAPGSGKSRLRNEFVQRARKSHGQFALLLGRGDSVRVGMQLGLVSSALRSWFEITHELSIEEKRERVLDKILPVAPTKARALAEFLGEVMGVPFPEDESAHLKAARRDPQLMADRMLASWLEWLEAQCAAGPVMFLLEDLHWSDPASVRLLDAALRSLKSGALLVLGFARPEVHETFPDLWSAREPVPIKLNKLSPKACERLLNALGLQDLKPEKRAKLIEHAEGNPFFLEELVRGLRTDASENLPDSLLGTVQARLDALGEEAKLVVQVASVFGQSFRVKGVQALLGGHMARVKLPERLATLTEREVIFPRGGPDDNDEYAFRHALIRDAAYLLWPDNERKHAHRLAGEWLESEGATEPALLADHYERGGALENAAVWYAAAATEALEAGSLDAVIKCGERAQACEAKGDVLGEVASLVAEALSYRGGDEAGTVRWAQIARRNLSNRVPGWWRASQVLVIGSFRLGDPAVDQTAAEMIRAARAGLSIPQQVIALAYASAESCRLSRFDLGEPMLKLLSEVDHDPNFSGRPQGCVHLARTVQGLCTGELSAAVREARASLACFRAAGAVRDTGEMLHLIACALLELGCYEEARRYLTEFGDLGRRVGTTRWIHYASMNLARIEFQNQNWAEAESGFLTSAEGYAVLQMPISQARSLTYAASARAQRGDVEGAVGLVAKALQLAAGDPGASAVVLAASARIRARAGQHEHALAAAERAVELLRIHHPPENKAFIHAACVEAFLGAGRDEEARRATVEATLWVRERADKIGDEALRTSFLTCVPENAEIERRFRELAPLLD